MVFSLSPGVYTLIQNQIYVLPSQRVVYANVVSGKSIQSSLTTTTTDFAGVTLSTTGPTLISLPFLRTTVADTVISIKYA